jgi:D-aspartate ligase
MVSRHPPVLVFGSSLTVLGAIRLLWRAGYDAYVATDALPIVRRSRAYRAAPPSAGGARAGDDLGAYLEGLPFERAVLLPCSDEWTLEVARHAGALSARFPSSVPRIDVAERLIDKWHLAEALRETGLPHPQTIALDANTDLSALPDSMLEASFIKPRDSEIFHRRFHVKAFRVGSRAEIAARLAEILPYGLSVQLQDYVRGPADNHYFVDGFIDRDGKVLGLLARRRLRMYPLDFGNSSYMETVALDAIPDAVHTVTALLAYVGYRGVFSAELKRDSRDNVLRLLEVNVRPWWFVEFAGRCGVDVIDMAVRDALHEPSIAATRYDVGRHCVYPAYDWDACLTLRREGKLSLFEWISSWVRSDQPVFDWTDPYPSIGSALATLGRRVTNPERRKRRRLG